jgi:deoxyribonuclease V
MTTASTTLRNFSITKANNAQACLSKKIIQEDRLPERIRLVAGVDAAYAGESAIGAAAVLDYASLGRVEQQTATCTARFPYVPTLLSFREIPPAVACIKKLKRQPDVFLVDGQGLAHPYRCGFASHLGLVLDEPTIGVAKSRLIGKPTVIHGDVFLVDNEQIIGAIVTTKEGVKPVYVSVGHLVSLKTAVKIVRHCVLRSRIPEPILQANKIATAERQRFSQHTQLQKI